MTDAPKIEKYGVDKLRRLVVGYDRQLDAFSDILETKTEAEDEAQEQALSLPMLDRTIKLMEKIPVIIKARDAIATMANGEEVSTSADSEVEKSAVQRRNNT